MTSIQAFQVDPAVDALPWLVCKKLWPQAHFKSTLMASPANSTNSKDARLAYIDDGLGSENAIAFA